MKRDIDSGQVFTRRAFVIGALQTGLLTVLGSRLAWLSVVQGSRYRVLAEKNRINMRLLAPARGEILDRNGTPLAVNAQNFRAILIPEQTDDLAAALSRLQKLIPITQRDIQRVMKQAQKSASYAPLEVKENLTWDEVSLIEVNLPDLPGISVDEGQIRQYPLKDATAHLVGYVGAVNKSELDEDSDQLLSLPNFAVGKSGLEKTYEDQLRGTAGAAQDEVNVVGRVVRELKRDTGVPGKALQLTIDAQLQKYMQDRLGQEKSASGVVMDALTGAVYALSSSPGFDPNNFTRGLTPEMWEAMSDDPALPMNNKAVGGLYPPGSCFKMVTAAAGLETGVITENTTQFCPGYFQLGNATFHCWKHEGHGTVGILDAITRSCDVFFYKMAVDIGVDRIAKYANLFGYGQKTGIELPEEKSGLIPTAAWKKNYTGESWQPGETVVTAIGQGYNQVTPLQLAVMSARLVSGRMVSPRLVSSVGGVAVIPDKWPALAVRPRTLAVIREGMNRVCNTQGGTAFAARITDARFLMGGKTGSAQVKHMTRAERAAHQKNEELPWNLRDQALFTSFAPVYNPRYACAVVVEHGMHGGSAAAPIARDILFMTQQRNPAGIEFPDVTTKEG
ncbi:MAG TPA: penicillin-binding protein 2 [Patescibacteria group bacterium]|nr:penicillin-binding protein 2 [Patescibacteria group bacterium]